MSIVYNDILVAKSENNRNICLTFKYFLEGPPKTNPPIMLVFRLICLFKLAPGKVSWSHVPQGTVGPELIIVPSPCLKFILCILY